MYLILLGPPGAGKGTQAQLLCKTFGLVQISTGDMLRQGTARGDALGNELCQVMERGALVSDDIINKLIQERVVQTDCASGFIFDGFPRTVEQAQSMLDSGIVIDHVIEIEIADELVIQRISGRRTHEASGRIYHMKYSPPKVAGKDDITGEPLAQRQDDAEHTIRERLRVYHRQTSPLVAFFRNLLSTDQRKAPSYHSVDGSQSVQKIHQNLVNILKSAH